MWCGFLFEGLRRVEKVWHGDCRTGLESQSRKRVKGQESCRGGSAEARYHIFIFDMENTEQASLVKKHGPL